MRLKVSVCHLRKGESCNRVEAGQNQDQEVRSIIRANEDHGIVRQFRILSHSNEEFAQLPVHFFQTAR